MKKKDIQKEMLSPYEIRCDLEREIEQLKHDLVLKDAAIKVLMAENKKLWEIVDRLKEAANNDSHQHSKCVATNSKKAIKHYEQSWRRLAGIIKGRAYNVNDGIYHFPRDDGEL